MTKTDYLLRFRRARSVATLYLMFERMMERTSNTKDRTNITSARDQREKEIEQDRLLNG